MNFDILKFFADHKIFFDQSVAFLAGFVIPIAVFRARINKMIFFLARFDVITVFGVSVFVAGINIIFFVTDR